MTTGALTRRITPLILRQRLRGDGAPFRAYCCWTAAASWRRLPRRQDLAMLEQPPLRDWIGVADAQPARGQFRYRFLGSELQRVAPRAAAGSLVGDAGDPSPFAQLDRAAFLEAAFQDRIVFSRRQLAGATAAPLRFDCLVLPLQDDDTGDATVLFAHDCGWWAAPQDGPAAASLPLPVQAGSQVVEVERLALSAMDPAHEYLRSG